MTRDLRSPERDGARGTDHAEIDLRDGVDVRRDRPRQPRVKIVSRRPQPGVNRPPLVSRARYHTSGLGKYDVLLLGAALSASLLGALLVWSATSGKLAAAGDDPRLFLTKHLLNLLIGASIAFGVTRVDYRTLRAHTPLIYGVSVGLLLLVLSPVGASVNGAQAWLMLPAGFSLQPGEIAKITVIIAMAHVVADRDVGSEQPQSRDVRRALLWAAGPVALIMLQPDLGTVLVIASTAVAVMAVAGAPARFVVGLLAAGVAGAAAVAAFGVLDHYQLERLTTFLDPDHDPLGSGYNTTQARIAIGAGGLFGSGLFSGHQTQGAFVPYQQTDFVFSVAGEELGFAGSTLVLALLGVVIWRGCVIARRSTDAYGRIIASGVVAWFAFQTFENVGMNLGIMPVTGVPLPFLSYGGSSMFAAWAGVGLLQSVALRSRA